MKSAEDDDLMEDVKTKGNNNWVIFKDPVNYDFRLVSFVHNGEEQNVAIDSGADLSEYFTDDIRGLPRDRHDYWSWDIGAFRATKEVIAIVDTDTGSQEAHYNSLNSAIQGESGPTPIAVATSSLVAGDEQLTIELRASTGLADTTSVTVQGFETAESNFIKIMSPQDHRHNGKWDTDKYRLVFSGSGNQGFVPKQNYLFVEDLQLGTTGSDNYTYAVYLNDDYGPITFNRSIFFSDSTGEYNRNRLNNGTLNFYNCTFEGFSYANETRNDHAILVAGANVTVLNSTAINNGVGFELWEGTLNCYNCIAVNNKSADFRWTSIGGSNNISSDDTAPGDNSLINQDPYAIFVDPDNGDFRLLSDSPAVNAGVNLSQYFLTDIVGTYRGQGGAWDIGAFEFVIPPDFRMRGQIQFEGNIRFE